MLDVICLPSVNCDAFCKKKKELDISHDSFGCGAFSGRWFGVGEISGCYYKLVYSNTKMQKEIQKTFGDGVMPFRADNGSTWAFKILKIFLD